mmetsp:Transcript_44612/g.108888  ORF Transcript_44612/g.108888 Transcript_44612/m.108888 type:complete len:285 (-) Transcript_44612:1220-2074(-)
MAPTSGSGARSRRVPVPVPLPPGEKLLDSSTRNWTFSAHLALLSSLSDEMTTMPCVGVSSMSMLVSPNSSIRPRIIDPPGPIILPMADCGTVRVSILGTAGESFSECVGLALSMWYRMCSLPSLACDSALLSRLMLSPSHLMSSWKAVMPLASPVILKSIVPSPSSIPRMSVRMTASSSIVESAPFLFSYGRNRPIATPATARLRGTPASSIARVPPQTLAIELLPQLSVISDSTRIVYGNSSSDGITARRPLSARFPWPISRRPGVPTRPHSPTEDGGKTYCR